MPTLQPFIAEFKARKYRNQPFREPTDRADIENKLHCLPSNPRGKLVC
jgi:hypothetical protein